MRENLGEVLVGAAVVAVAAGFLFYTASTTGYGTGAGGSYAVHASFRSVEGVQLGTDVRLAGVKIGTVTGLQLDKDTFRANAELSLDKGIEIPDDSSAVISSEGLLGGNFVEIMPGGSLDALADGAEIIDTQGSVSLISLLLKFVSGGDSSQ